jgi:hypothetical protein
LWDFMGIYRDSWFLESKILEIGMENWKFMEFHEVNGGFVWIWSMF